MTQQLIDAKMLSDLAINGLLEKKGQDIVRMDLQHADGAITDYFVICTGTSDRHVQSLADSVLVALKKNGEIPFSREGLQTGQWILLDYVNVVVHIFQKDARDFYRLESLWGDAECEKINAKNEIA